VKDSWRIEQHISQQCGGGNEVGVWVIVETRKKSWKKLCVMVLRINNARKESEVERRDESLQYNSYHCWQIEYSTVHVPQWEHKSSLGSSIENRNF